jgi:CelD/BcsL family acetyltransferase involved in cellulose biosynthesis
MIPFPDWSRFRFWSSSSARGSLVEMVSDAPGRSASALLVLPPDDEHWLEFVQQHPEALPFHHPSWSWVLSESYGYRPFVLAIVDGQGQVDAGMPVMEIRTRFHRPRWVSLPFTDRCPPLAVDEVTAARLVELADRAREDAAVACLEFHADVPRDDVHRQPRGVAHALSLSPDADLIFKGFKRSQVQRNVRKAERSGLELRRTDAEEDLTESFYRLHLRTRRRLGVPVQPRRFFEFLWRRVIAQGRGFVLLASRGGVPIAGAVFLTGGRTVVYKFGASEPSSWPLRPNNLIFWDAIRWSCQNGFTTFDFGRSDLDDWGLRNFKSGWGAVEEPLVYAALGGEPPRVGPRVGASLIPRLIRRGPLWLCRAIGAAAYRHAA